jgi:hypothetical protein
VGKILQQHLEPRFPLEPVRFQYVASDAGNEYDLQVKSPNRQFELRNSHMAIDSHRPPKNIWDGIFMPVGIAIAWYLFSKPIFILRQIGMPSDSFLASNASELSLLLFFLGVGFVSLGPGLMLSNFTLWTIPFIRNQQNRLCEGHGDRVFKQANKDLLKFSVAMFILVYPVSFFRGLNYYALAPEGVSYRPWFGIHPVHYEWQQIKEIRTACYSGSKGSNGQYSLVFEDGRKIDLNTFSTRDFFSNYSTISKFLNGVPFDFHFDGQMSESCPRSWRPYFQNRP